MEHILTEMKKVATEQGNMTLRYELLAETKEGMTQYGAAVTNENTEERTRVMELTADRGRAAEFFGRISRGNVTPMTMREVAEDFVAEF